MTLSQLIVMHARYACFRIVCTLGCSDVSSFISQIANLVDYDSRRAETGFIVASVISHSDNMLEPKRE